MAYFVLQYYSILQNSVQQNIQYYSILPILPIQLGATCRWWRSCTDEARGRRRRRAGSGRVPASLARGQQARAVIASTETGGGGG